MTATLFLIILMPVAEESSISTLLINDDRDEERVWEYFSGLIKASTWQRKVQRLISSLLLTCFALSFYSSSCLCDANSCSSFWTFWSKNTIELACVNSCYCNDSSFFLCWDTSSYSLAICDSSWCFSSECFCCFFSYSSSVSSSWLWSSSI